MIQISMQKIKRAISPKKSDPVISDAPQFQQPKIFTQNSKNKKKSFVGPKSLTKVLIGASPMRHFDHASVYFVHSTWINYNR